jgi:hypothetical protein
MRGSQLADKPAVFVDFSNRLRCLRLRSHVERLDTCAGPASFAPCCNCRAAQEDSPAPHYCVLFRPPKRIGAISRVTAPLRPLGKAQSVPIDELATRCRELETEEPTLPPALRRLIPVLQAVQTFITDGAEISVSSYFAGESLSHALPRSWN